MKLSKGVSEDMIMLKESGQVIGSPNNRLHWSLKAVSIRDAVRIGKREEVSVGRI
jgi:hypothetical protein